MQEGSRHLLKLKSTGDCLQTNSGAHLIEMPDDDAVSRGRLPWCVQCGIEFGKTEAELMSLVFAHTAAARELREAIMAEFIGDDFSDYNSGLKDALQCVGRTVARLEFTE